MALLTPEVQAIIRKPESDRTPEEQKISDDYYPVLRIDPDKIKEVMPKEEIAKYNALLKEQSGHRDARRRCPPTGRWKKIRRC